MSSEAGVGGGTAELVVTAMVVDVGEAAAAVCVVLGASTDRPCSDSG